MRIAGFLLGIALAALLFAAPQATLAVWRALFLAAGSVPIGAVALLMIARLTGADWRAALVPFARPAPLLIAAVVPVIVQQALFVAPPAHLAGWLWWPAFAARSLIAIGIWCWLARSAVAGRLSQRGAAIGLVAHGLAVTIVGTDWILGVAPGQPQSAIGMVLVTMQLLAACAAACLLRTGDARVRRDLSFLLLAAALGLGYLLFMDFLSVWYGNLPQRVGGYVARGAMPWRWLPPAALGLGLAVPIAATAFGRDDRARRVAGGSALVGAVLIATWLVVPGMVMR